jgi:hypothetical protein
VLVVGLGLGLVLGPWHLVSGLGPLSLVLVLGPGLWKLVLRLRHPSSSWSPLSMTLSVSWPLVLV